MDSVAEVFRIIESQVRGSLGTERVAVGEGLGRRLAAGVAMDGDSPPFDRALLDGFAVRSAEAVPGARLMIVGRQDAGPGVFSGVVGKGECVGINTGGVFPRGADAVLMVEHSRLEADGRTVEVREGMGPGYGVQKRGADARSGEVVLEAGTVMGPAQLAAAVMAGAGELVVAGRVRAAVLTTGDELVAAGGAIGGGQIRNSNQPMLLGLLRRALGEGGEVVDLGTAGDERELLRERLERGLREADVVVVTGGMSMGTRDLVPGVLKELGVAFHVERVRMKPGKPFVLGTVEAGGRRRYVAGLPGNPVSAFVTFEVFVREVLEILGGGRAGERWVRARAGGDFSANGEREFFQPCGLKREGEALVARALAWKGSGDVFSLARAQGLVRRAPGAAAVVAGEGVEVLRI